jgi:transcription elongation GreA/GreB family factor
MSVAFRRESDEEHKEPRFELPIPVGPNLVTPRGEALIAERIAALEAALVGAEAEAAEAIRRDLRYWQTRRTTAIPTTAPADGTIGFASTVDILLDGRARRVRIVGDDEADPKAGDIAVSAPLARALLGGEAGDLLPFAGRDDAIEVVAVA